MRRMRAATRVKHLLPFTCLAMAFALAMAMTAAPGRAQTVVLEDAEIEDLERRVGAGLRRHLYDFGGTKHIVEVGQCAIWIREQIRDRCDAAKPPIANQDKGKQVVGGQVVMIETSIELAEVRQVRLGEHAFNGGRRIARFTFDNKMQTVRQAAEALRKENAKPVTNVVARPGSLPKKYRYAPGDQVKTQYLDRAGIYSHQKLYMCTGLIHSQQDEWDLHVHLTGEDLPLLLTDLRRYLRHCNPESQSDRPDALKGFLKNLVGEEETKAERLRNDRNLTGILDKADDKLDRRLRDIH